MAKKPFQNKGRRKEPKEFEEEVIQIDRVTRVVKGGRRLRFRATVVIGDKKGRVGYGIGKSTEVQAAIQKAVSKAKNNLIEVPLYSGSIPHTIQVKFKAAIVFLRPAGEGTGIIAGGAVRKMLDLAGVRNVLSKSIGSNNRLNTTKATFKALSELRRRPEKETDKEKANSEKASMSAKSDPNFKKMSKKEAREKVEANQRGSNVKKKPAAKNPTDKKTEAKKAPAKKAKTTKE